MIKVLIPLLRVLQATLDPKKNLGDNLSRSFILEKKLELPLSPTVPLANKGFLGRDFF